jgi:hypothetical protein
MFISRGNIKVKANIFNLPCFKTCKPGLACRKYCYANKAARLYKQVTPCRENNLKLSKSPNFVAETVKLLKTRKNKIVRFHESGDVYSVAYIRKLYAICRELPDYKFYTYTKRDDLFTTAILAKKPRNFTLSYSYDGVKGADFKAKLKKGYDNVTVVSSAENNCPAIKSEVKCMVDCKKCLNGKNKVIIFKKH